MKTLDIRQIIDYIEGHIADGVSLTDIARQVNYSPYYCSVRFREYMGTSIKKYILRRKLECAARVLLETELRIIDIAIQYGYHSQESFSRAFAKLYGISPYEYRQMRYPISHYRTYYDVQKLLEGEYTVNQQDKFDTIEQNIEQKCSGKVLHILNGSCMLEAFKQSGKMREGCTYISFNEAMCWGAADEEIFSEPFIEKRIQSLKSTQEQYSEIVLEPLKPLFEERFDLIVMWFGDDLFCQMNMLTMMAYLEQMNYEGDLLLCIGTEGDGEFLPEAYEVSIEGASQAYKSLVCRGKMPKQDLLPVTYQMAKLYLEYRLETSEISKYIMKYPNKEKELLVAELLQRFPQYGLGDLQYEMMIDEWRK